MIYVNKRTGATIDSPCLLSGDDWELISEADAKEAEEVATVEKMETVEEADAKEAEEVAEKAAEKAAETAEVKEAEKAEEVKEEKPKKRNNKKGE
ncbi:hypothetical protein [Fenollaria massiliensis]|uniref:hypothetical protein n=1 Tax=Fenollaria massiliensis TaxID=938288 RepID=UPI00037E12E7|nr:hypothetical protein [Fenollaria massiliensis]